MSHHGPLARLLTVTNEYPAFGKHSMASLDRLGNPDIDFPIGIVFGDADFLGSEGSEEIVRSSKFFASGESQLFKLQDCGHNMHFGNPEQLANIIIGFFNGTIKGRFEPKAFLDYRPRTNLA